MAPIQEAELAGIGRKFVIETRSGNTIIVVIQDTGKVELYSSIQGKKDETTYIATLEDDEARQVAAIIGRTIYRPESIERLDQQGVAIYWHVMAPQSSAIGKTLGETGVMEHTEVSVIAATGKDGTKRVNPDSGYVLQEGTQLALAGTSKQIQAYVALLEKRMA